ncbi:MAG: NUDIX domain-containing protein [Rhodospirillaceae bacterium]|nr:NUDIX domain-containing protein [Rhodospirillaceae bacterium]
MGPSDVEILDRRNLYRGYGRLDLYRLRHRLFAGGWTPEFDRELLDRGHAVAVLPYDPVADAVVLIEQFRLGAHAAGLSPWQVECVAGIIDEGETAEAVARRECEEEAGCALGELVPLGRFLASPGISNETVALFVARADGSGRDGAIHGLHAEHEDIRVIVMPFQAALDLVDRQALTNVPALIALQWLARHRADLRRRWVGPPR